MHFQHLLATTLLLGVSYAAPYQGIWRRQGAVGGTKPDGYVGPLAVDLIKAIMPESVTCDMAKFPGCSTAANAAPHFISAFKAHDVKSAWEIAAVLALTAHESLQLKYRGPAAPNDNNRGQGTSNMQSIKFNLEFANSIPEVKAKVTSILAGSTTPTPDQAGQIVALLQDDKYNFRSGAWFLATHCAAERPGITNGTHAGWQAYIEGCVGVSKATAVPSEWESREKYWAAAMTAFGLKYNQ